MATKKTKAIATPSAKADKKRADILKAAGRCFRRTGFHLASMQEICTETELGPGAVYRYFPSKDAIIEAMAEDERVQARAILATLAPGGDLGETLATISRALFDRYRHAQDAGMMSEVYAEGLRNRKVGAIVRKAEGDWVDGLSALLAAARDAGQLDAGVEPRQAALLLTALWDGMVLRQAYHPEDRSAALDGFFETSLRKILMPGAAAGVTSVVAPAAPAAVVEAPAKPEKAEKAEKRPRTVALPVVEMPPVAEKDERQMSLI